MSIDCVTCPFMTANSGIVNWEIAYCILQGDAAGEKYFLTGRQDHVFKKIKLPLIDFHSLYFRSRITTRHCVWC